MSMTSEKQQQYEKYVKQITPTHSLGLNMLKAFLTGGLICMFGQLILHYAYSLGLDRESAASWCSLILILISVLLTGLNLYSKIGRFAGAGSLVPITGFANSVAASAIEYKVEGHVFGIGCKIFTIAGPVILYGILSSWILGLIYYLLKITGYFHDKTIHLWNFQHFLSRTCVYPELCLCNRTERRRRSSGLLL